MMACALPRATAKLSLCRSQARSLLSSDSAAIRRPSSARNVLVVQPMTPVVSTAAGWNMNLSVKLVYFCSLFVSARLAAYPGCRAVWRMLLAAKVSLQVASHTNDLPCLYGKTVIPSGRRPSPLSRPGGSRLDGMPAVVRARLMMSLIAAWRGNLPAL